MNVVSAKCPNCGASIQLDNERSEGFCLYCGSKVIVEDAISLIKIDKSGDLQNYLNLSKTAIEGNNGDEAYKYANKALEMDSSNAEAWYIKMKAVGLTSIIKELKCNEIITAGKKAMQFSDNNQDMESKVYTFFLESCISNLRFCTIMMSDIKNIKDLYNANLQLNAFKATENTLASDTIVDFILAQEQQILDLRLSVPNSEISKSPDLTRVC